MLRKLITALKERRKWNAEFKESWKGFNDPDSDGIAKIQKKCLEEALKEDVISDHEYLFEDDTNEYVLLLRSKGSRAYFRVYDCDAELDGVDEFYHVEQCGCVNPEEFTNQVIDKLRDYA